MAGDLARLPHCAFCGAEIRAGDVHTTGASNCCTLFFEDGTIRQYYFREKRWIVVRV
jgi:hypothetical protein